MDISTDSEEEAEMPRRSALVARFIDRPLWQRIGLAVLGFVLLPYLLIVFYLLPFVHPISTLMLRDAATFQGYDRRWVPLDQISPVLVKSVMVSEDGQFCFHGGVDWGEMRALVRQTLKGEATRGGSTIPMQTAKNLFLWNGRSFVRKTLELPLAVTSSFVWSKRRMMEIYLNIAEWGPGIYGIEAAARYHFKVPASKLTARQAALLAVSLPNPIDRVASKPGRGLRQLASLIQRRAANSGEYIKCLYN
ncbi:MAG: monofunctional biosynthetic peptidoglycan transglycosylase [Rhizobium sp.]